MTKKEFINAIMIDDNADRFNLMDNPENELSKYYDQIWNGAIEAALNEFTSMTGEEACSIYGDIENLKKI